jgi:hypothetical protein
VGLQTNISVTQITEIIISDYGCGNVSETFNLISQLLTQKRPS